jgi:hypothetical protein
VTLIGLFLQLFDEVAEKISAIEGKKGQISGLTEKISVIGDGNKPSPEGGLAVKFPLPLGDENT